MFLLCVSSMVFSADNALNPAGENISNQDLIDHEHYSAVFMQSLKDCAEVDSRKSSLYVGPCSEALRLNKNQRFLALRKKVRSAFQQNDKKLVELFGGEAQVKEMIGQNPDEILTQKGLIVDWDALKQEAKKIPRLSGYDDNFCKKEKKAIDSILKYIAAAYEPKDESTANENGKIDFLKLQKMITQEELLWMRCDMQNRKMHHTLWHMKAELDTGSYNGRLPYILYDLCRKSSGMYVPEYCKELQGCFHGKEMDELGSFSPYSASFGQLRNPDESVKKLCQYLPNVSVQTKYELLGAVRKGYNGNGHCESFDKRIDEKREAELNHQLTRQFPEPLRKHCDENPESSRCAELREQLYCVQNPDTLKEFGVIEQVSPISFGNEIFSLYMEQRNKICKRDLKNCDESLCADNDSFGCSFDQYRRCDQEFKELLQKNKKDEE